MKLGNKTIWFLLISTISYCIFFTGVFNPALTIYSGSDSVTFFYPSRFFLFESLRNGNFPFWTNRLFGGFLIFADLERAYLHPLNLLTTFIFGPILSFKILHFLSYLAGSFGLFKFLERKEINIWGFLVANLIFYFSFFHIFHQQHFGITLTSYLFPLLIYLTDLYLEKKGTKVFAMILAVFVAMFYWGSVQTVIIMLFGQFLFVLSQVELGSIKKTSLFYVLYAFLALAVALPLLIPSYNLFKESKRVEVSYTEGSFIPPDLTNLVFPFPYGSKDNYFGELIAAGHFKHEIYIYFGISTLIFGLISYFSVDRKLKKFSDYVFLSFVVLGFINFVPALNKWLLPPFSIFRYWGRISILLVFAFAWLVAEFVSKNNKFNFKISKLLFASFLVLILVLINWYSQANLNVFLYVLKTNFVFEANFYVWVLLLIFTFVSLKINKKTIFALIIVLDLIFFGKYGINFKYVKTADLIPPIEQTLDMNDGLYYDQLGFYGYTPLAPLGFDKTNPSQIVREMPDLQIVRRDLYLSILGSVTLLSLGLYAHSRFFEKE